MKYKAWQVSNSGGYPASTEWDDLCIFPTEQKARNWVVYLQGDLGIDEVFTVRSVVIHDVFKGGDEG